MEIKFNKYKPRALKIEINKLEKFLNYKYHLPKKKFEEILNKITKKDIDIEELKAFLYNLDYLPDKDISTYLYQIKLKKNNDIENIEYCYYWVYLNYYTSEYMENIYIALTKLGKSTFKYTNSSKIKNEIILNFHQLFHQGKNINFFTFLYNEFQKRVSLKNFSFFEDYFINYNSKLAKEIINKYFQEFQNTKDKKIEENIETLKEIMKM